VIRDRTVFPDGSLVEIVVWRLAQPVPPADHHFKYRLVYVVDGERVLGYDNERGKGDHRHTRGREEPFSFASIEDLLARFVEEVEALQRRRS
jgi:hypothetical protein